MTDILDRSAAFVDPDPGDGGGSGGAGDDIAAPRSSRAGATATLPPALRIPLAALSAAAGAIHLVMVPAHAGESTVLAVSFAVAGWFQLAAAALIALRPTRRPLALVALANVAMVAVWALSRTRGLPLSGSAGAREAVSPIDLTCVALEAALVIGLVLMPVRRSRRQRHPGRVAWGLATATAIGALVVASVALMAPSTQAHTHDEGTGSGAIGATGAAGHTHSHTGNADEQAELAPDVTLDDATRTRLGGQLVQARDAALRYPTVRDARAAGLLQAGLNAPGVGAHFQDLRGGVPGLNPDGTVDAAHPSTYIYGGTLDDAPLVGLMYVSTSAEAPEGFAGPNDHWHRHANLCVKYVDGKLDVPFPVDTDVTKAQCDQVAGNFMERTVWMVHAWVVPGWESPQGVFSHANPNLHCRDGSDDVDGVGFCKVP